MDDEFKEIFRRAFASRIFPPEIVKKMGGKHVRGILLYGPPGCGKTLIARSIGKEYGFSLVSRFLLRILTGHIHSNCRVESKLQFECICSVRIFKLSRDVNEKT